MKVKQVSIPILKRRRELETAHLRTTMKEDIYPQRVELQNAVTLWLILMFLMSKLARRRRRQCSNKNLPGEYPSISLRRPWPLERFHPRKSLSWSLNKDTLCKRTTKIFLQEPGKLLHSQMLLGNLSSRKETLQKPCPISIERERCSVGAPSVRSQWACTRFLVS